MTWSSAGRAAALAIGLTLAYTQLPLYSSNQNTYFLHGLAQSGFGHLANDWLAHTTDVVPVFSALVRWTAGVRWPPLFNLYLCVLFGIYLLGLLGIARLVLGIRFSSRTEWILAAALIALHASLLGIVSVRAFGVNVPRLFERGLADQYLLGPVFQPSNFGVLLIAAIVAAARQRHAPAIVCLALAATFHPTYLLIAGMLTLTLVGVMLRSGRGAGDAGRIALLAALLLAPITAYVVTHFPSSPVHTAATEILVKVRLPHHADITTWFGPGSIFQLLLMGAGLWLARGTAVFPFLFWPFVAGAALVLVQVLTRSPSLALLFPWRFSVVLVPVSTTLIVGRLVLWARDRLPRHGLARPRLAEASVAATLLLFAASGLVGTVLRSRSAVPPKDRALFDAVRAAGGPEDLCLIPPAMEDFRLRTGIPVLVDEKNHPIRDAEVMEWWQRIGWTRRLLGAGADSVSSVMRDLLARYPVTMVVAGPGNAALARCDVLAPGWREAGGYTLYRVNTRSRSSPGPP